MRNWVPKLLMVSILFVSMEGVAESVDDQSFHQTHHAHADEAGGGWHPDMEGDDDAADSCEHFCHLHVVGLVALHQPLAMPAAQFFALIPASQSVARTVPPPDPPPNR